MRRFLSLWGLACTGCLAIGIAMLICACSKAEEFIYVDEQVITEDGSGITVTDENGNVSLLPSGTVIGVYVVDEDGNVSMLEVEVDEDGNAILPASAGSTVIAYSPYQEDWGEDALTQAQLFEVSGDQRSEADFVNSDLMIGSTGSVTRSGDGAMNFVHMLCKVAVHVVDETGRLDLSGIQLELLNVNNNVEVDLLHQSVATIDNERKDIYMRTETTTDWRVSSYAIVAPQTVGEGADFFAVTLFGERQVYALPQESALEGGKMFSVTVRLTEHGLIFEGGYIRDWTDGGEEDLEC